MAAVRGLAQRSSIPSALPAQAQAELQLRNSPRSMGDALWPPPEGCNHLLMGHHPSYFYFQDLLRSYSSMPSVSLNLLLIHKPTFNA